MIYSDNWAYVLAVNYDICCRNNQKRRKVFHIEVANLIDEWGEGGAKGLNRI